MGKFNWLLSTFDDVAVSASICANGKKRKEENDRILTVTGVVLELWAAGMPETQKILDLAGRILCLLVSRILWIHFLI